MGLENEVEISGVGHGTSLSYEPISTTAQSYNASMPSLPVSTVDGPLEPTQSESAEGVSETQGTIRIAQNDLVGLLQEKDRLSSEIFQLQAEYNTYRYEKSEEIVEIKDKLEKLTNIEEELIYFRNQNNMIIEIDKKQDQIVYLSQEVERVNKLYYEMKYLCSDRDYDIYELKKVIRELKRQIEYQMNQVSELNTAGFEKEKSS